MQEIVDLWQSSYIDPFGLTRITPSPPESPEVVGNNNGILFSAMMIFMLDEAGYDVSVYMIQMFKAIQSIRVAKGYFIRRPIQFPSIPENFDNYKGIEGLSVFYNFVFHREILEVGEDTGFRYKSYENPDQFDMNFERQWGERAMYKLTCSKLPTTDEMLGLFGGLILSAVLKDPSNVDKAWLTFRLLFKKFKNDGYPPLWFSLPFVGVYLVWLFFIWSRGGMKFFLAHYFPEGHPIHAACAKAYG